MYAPCKKNCVNLNRKEAFMAHNHLFEEEQFVISQELLLVLHWLLKYEETELSRIITQASIKGFEEKLKTQDVYHQLQHSDDLQNSIVQFLSFLENHVASITTQETNKKIMHHNVVKALDHIDPKRFDYDTIKSTVLATAEKIKPRNQHNAKDLFLKELLKQWNPKKDKDQKATLN
jgi:hypothetical protein